MTRLASMFLALVGAAAAVGQDQGTPPVGLEAGVDFLGGPLEVLSYSQVRDELKLTEEQARQLDGLRRLSRPDAIPGVTIRNLQGVQKSARADLLRILKPKQLERLSEVILQGMIRAGGLAAVLGDPGVHRALGLEDAQKKRIRLIVESAQKARPNAKDSAKKAEDARRKANEAKLTAVLTEDQKAKLAGLQGEPFKELKALFDEHHKRRDEARDEKAKKSSVPSPGP